jgi:hypothetical protein
MEVELRQEAGSEHVDLLDLCTVYTLKHDGKVYALPRDQMPVDDSPVAALLRFQSLIRLGRTAKI